MSKIASKMTSLTVDSPFVDAVERAQTLYFNWLCLLVHVDDYMTKEWYILAKLLHNMEYYSIVDHDDNRAADGINLRHTWFNLLENEAEDFGVSYPIFPLDSLSGPCTLLEMLVGFSVRIESDIMQDKNYVFNAKTWFWNMVANVLCYDEESANSLIQFSDNMIDDRMASVLSKKFTDMMDRSYKTDGTGGLFPLQNPSEDQTKVELWYQAQAWLMEHYYNKLGED